MEEISDKIDDIFENWHGENPKERQFLYVMSEENEDPVFYNAMGTINNTIESFVAILLTNYDLYLMFQEIMKEVEIERAKKN